MTPADLTLVRALIRDGYGYGSGSGNGNGYSNGRGYETIDATTRRRRS